MNVQNIIVFLIVAAAGLYVGSLVWQKVKSLSSKTACGKSCGCDGTKTTAKNSLVNIRKS